MLACARIGAVHSVVFGGFAAPELATRIDDATPKVIVSASCGIEGSRVIEYKPMLDRAIELAGHKPGRCVILQRPQAAAELTAGRDLDWDEAAAEPQPADCVPVARDRPAVHPVHLGHHGQAQGRGPRQRRARGGAAVDDGQHLRHRAGRGVLGRLRRRLGGRPLLHRVRAAAGRLHHGAVRGQAGRHAGRGRVLAGGRRARGEDPVHRADRDPRDQEGGPGRVTVRSAHDLSRFQYLFLAGERLDPDTYQWAGRTAGVPVHRPLVADRDRLADRGEPARAWSRCRPSPGPRRCRSPATTCASWTPTAPRCRPATTATIVVRAAATAGLPAHAVGRRRAVRRRRTCRPHPGYYTTGDGGYRRRGRLRLRDGPHRRRDQRRRAPAVHRRDGGGAGQPPRGGRVRGDRGARRRSRARCRAGSWCSRRASRSRLPTASARSWSQLVREQIGPVAAFAGSTWCRRCRRPGPARSCARPCAASPTARGAGTVHDRGPGVLDALRPVLGGD